MQSVAILRTAAANFQLEYRFFAVRVGSRPLDESADADSGEGLVGWTPRPSEIFEYTDGRGVHPTHFERAAHSFIAEIESVRLEHARQRGFELFVSVVVACVDRFFDLGDTFGSHFGSFAQLTQHLTGGGDFQLVFR